jgi:hypothetical protein
MIWTLVGIIFFLIVILIAFRVSVSRQKVEEGDDLPLIHASGIYSIVRKSPRETLRACKPTDAEIRKYLAQRIEITPGRVLTSDEKDDLISQWQALMEENIVEIENGDKEGVEFYYYIVDEDDAVSHNYVKKGNFVTREEIHNFPQIIPPLHLGCSCRLQAHHGSENLRETTELGIRPFFHNENLPPLPSWKEIVKPK